MSAVHVLPVVDTGLELSEVNSNVEGSKVIEFIEGAAWLLENALSSDECDLLLQECQHYHADTQYGLSYCYKSCFDDPEMASRIQQRITECFHQNLVNQHVSVESLEIKEESMKAFYEQRQLDISKEYISRKQMAKTCLIEQLRFISYPSGGYIGPHTDGVRVCPTTLNLTKITMILYLQDSSTGLTKFLLGDKTSYKEICTIKPQKGTMLLFQHQLLHMGDGVGAEGKILLRGDLFLK